MHDLDTIVRLNNEAAEKELMKRFGRHMSPIVPLVRRYAPNLEFPIQSLPEKPKRDNVVLLAWIVCSFSLVMLALFLRSL